MITPHEINSTNKFICGFYNTDTSFCDDIIQYFKSESCKDKFVGNVYSIDGGLHVDDNVKISYEARLDKNELLYHAYMKKLQGCVDEYLNTYQYAGTMGKFRVTSFTKIQYYPPNGGFFEWHTERFSNIQPYVSRHLVFMTYLNDVKEGGETEFYHQDLKVKPKKGLTLIWPADWTFVHRGIPSSQEKYIVTGWFNFV